MISPRCFCITGPTASGKTSIALELAQWCGAEIVSMDSAVVYRHMDIGTDKPTLSVRETVPHHLVDIREPEDTYSAGAFARDAAKAVCAANARGRFALVVGGTLLYLRALRDGLADLPARDTAVRDAIRVEADLRGWPAMHAELASVDPAAAARIRPGDRQRIERALEVWRVTGETLTHLQRRADRQGIDVPAAWLVPEDRGRLATAIAKRFDSMVAAGFVDEVEALRARPMLTAETPSMRSVGYRQIWIFLDGGSDWMRTRERAIAATRQLAKRQLTWLRGDTECVGITGSCKARLDALKSMLASHLDA